MNSFRIFILLYICFISASCQEVAKKASNPEIVYTYEPTILPKDTAQLWATDGNVNADTVLVICQGGPSQNLMFIEKGRTSYRYIPNYSNYYVAYLHQAQTWNKEITNYKERFTLQMAQEEVDNTSEMLYRALSYFKSQGKVIIVIGTSYGAYIIPNYLSTRTSLADKYIIIAGRIDENKQMLAQHLGGFNGEFEEDGMTYIPEDEHRDLSEYSEQDLQEYRIKQLLKAAIGKPRYSRELSDVNLSNVVYFYATNDKNVGGLTNQEIDFLESKGVQLFETRTGHSETLYRFIDKLIDGSLSL